MRRKAIYNFVAIVSFAFIIGCGSQNTQTSENDNSEADSSYRRKSIALNKIQSLKTRPIVLKDSVLGLFFGHFDPTPVVAKLQARYDSLEAAAISDGDYYTFDYAVK